MLQNLAEIQNKVEITVEESQRPYIGKNKISAPDGLFTPEIMWAIGAVDEYSVSPDNKKIAYVVTYYDVDENTGHNTLHVMDLDGTNHLLLTTSSDDENSPVWIKNGTKILFLSDQNESNQIWELNPDGTERKQITNYPFDIFGFNVSPDEKYILYI